MLAGPRQIGKSQLARDVLAGRPTQSYVFHDTDRPEDPEPTANKATTTFVQGRRADAEWLTRVWQQAVHAARTWQELTRESRLSGVPYVLVIDEIQRIPRWSEVVKGLWDELHATGCPMHVVVLGSSPLLLQRGLTESLMGRFELLKLGHWSFHEMRDAFGFSLEQFVHFGGYPGAATYIGNEERWRSFVRSSLIDPTIGTDVLQLARVEKPALLRQLFEVGCASSGQIVAMTKVAGLLQDAGNTTTLTGYLSLLSQAGMLAGLMKHSAHAIRQRAAPPKFQVLNTALMTACCSYGFDGALADKSHWGRVIESAVGAHLLNTADAETDVRYWRESPHEVDFVIAWRGRIACIEVKSGDEYSPMPGLKQFVERHGACRQHIVGAQGMQLAEFLIYPARHWVE